MTDRLQIAIAQINPTVGDIARNAQKLRDAHAEAARQGADLVVATELCLAGYPPEDLILKPAFVAACEAAAQELAEATRGGPGFIIGCPWREHGKVYNAALLLEGGRVASVRLKHELPNYGVFDEKRVFAAGPAPGPIPFRGVRLGVMVCEDMWFPDVDRDAAGIRRRAPHRHQRLALRERQARPAALLRRRPHQGERAAAPLREPGLRPGRAGVRRRVLRPRRRLPPQGAGAGLARDRRADGLAPAAGRTLEHRARRDGAAERRARGDLRRDGAGAPGLRAEEPLSRRRAGAFGRHRFRAHRRGCRRRAGRRQGALRDDALALYLPREPGGCRGGGEVPRHRLPHHQHRAGDAGLQRHVQGRLRRPRGRHHRGEHPVAPARHDPHGRSPTSSAGWCSPPATSRRCPWAMPRSTATCAAAIPC